MWYENTKILEHCFKLEEWEKENLNLSIIYHLTFYSQNIHKIHVADGI